MSSVRNVGVVVFCLFLVACGKVQSSDPDARPGGNSDGGSGGDAAAQPTCTDGMQNGDETGVDCGGSQCAACVECSGNSDCDSNLCVDNTCRTSRLEPCTDQAPSNATSVDADVVTNYTPGSGWSTPAACDWNCNADYFQDGQTCINNRLADCTDNAPANATSTITQVQITYTDAGGWSTPADCQWSCNADYFDDGNSCINTRTVQCTDNPPANGSSILANVQITYTDANGWSTPATCDFNCNVDYCKSSGQCVYAYNEMSFQPASSIGGSWFGGDDRAGIGPRNLGGGQSFKPTANLTMAKFAFYYTGAFRHASGSGGTEAVTIQAELRNANGAVLKTNQVNVPATFNGGWVWFNLPYTLTAGTQYIVTSWVVNGYTQGVNSGIRGNTANAYASGFRYDAAGSGSGLSSWTLWSGSGGTGSWDYWFWARSAPACAQP